MAENEIAVAQKNDVVQKVDMQTISEYLDSTGLTKQLMPNEKAMFINMAKDYGLNPFKREIYCTVYGEGQWRKCSIVTGYEVYLKRAERIGKLNGWNCQVSGSLKDGTLAATVTIYRKDWQYPFTHTAYYIECVNKNKNGQPNAIWAKMPIFMTKKVAIAQAFRLCFSDEFGGMPYTNDEIGVEPLKNDDTSGNVKWAEQPNLMAKKVEDYQKIQNMAEAPKEEIQVVDMNAVQSEEPPIDYEFENARSFLATTIQNYRKNLYGQPYDLANQALQSNDLNQIKAMTKRVVDYLGRQGIMVEAA